MAQATGPVPYRGWAELAAHLPGGEDAAVEELEHAYRVPREIMDFSLPLLEVIAPDVRPPRAYRTGADPPRDRGTGRSDGTRLAGGGAASGEGLVAIIAPASLRAGEAALSVFDEQRVPVLTPRESKGLEFDHVVVVEPARIVDGGRRGRPARALRRAHAADDVASAALVGLSAGLLPRTALPLRLLATPLTPAAKPGKTTRVALTVEVRLPETVPIGDDTLDLKVLQRTLRR